MLTSKSPRVRAGLAAYGDRALLLGAAFSFLLASGTYSHVMAQDTEQAADDDTLTGTVDDVVVTGTRVQSRTVGESTSPITVIGGDELRATGKQNLRDALNELDTSFRNSAGFSGQTGIAVRRAALRGLSADQTLILVNGKRRHSTALIFTAGQTSVGASPVDLDLIPTSLVAHIEILRDGAAAQYGSDAIAGVINIILKENAEGGDANITLGRYLDSNNQKHGYGPTAQLSINQGFEIGDGGFFSLGGDIDIHGFTNVAGPAPRESPGGVDYNIYPGGGTDPRETSVTRYRQILGLPKGQTYNIGYNAELPVTFGDQAKLYSFSTFGHRYSQGWGTFRNPNSPQNVRAVYPDGFEPQFVVEEDDYQITAGLKGGAAGGLFWDLSTTFGQSRANVRNENSLNPSFGPASPRDLDNGWLISTEWTTNLDLSQELATGAFEKPLNVAGGFEFRYNRFQEKEGEYHSWADGGYENPDFPAGSQGHFPLPGSAGMAGFAPENAGNYDRNNVATYLDFDQNLTSDWNVSIAGRYESYSDFGETVSGKASSRYQIFDWIAARATVSNGFRAPSLQQQFYGSSLPAYGTDPVTGVPNQLRYTRYVPSTSSLGMLLGGEPLQPETSRNYSVGLILNPLEHLNVTLDLYQIDIDDRITSITLQASQIAPILAANGLETNQNVSYFTNAVNTRTRGLDIKADYVTDFDDYGVIKWSLQSTFNRHKVTGIADNPPELAGINLQQVTRNTIGNLTVANPKNVTALSAAWLIDDFTVNVRETRYSEVRGLNALDPARDEVVRPAFITDLSVGYNVTDQVTFTLGGNNIFNVKPDQLPEAAIWTSGGALLYGFPAVGPNYSFYSPYGVYGGFYYARLSLTW
ncbi:TonB-dependent receptor [Oleomonas cavernae]|uniref:TonB-dependent receptor n=1 Tax=Oleomonas cavernae TaxID=2320859 RepID=A0A418W8K0_9PROT|nr:TonB-dependent receptor [Oleomonas cavernae]RJF86341.1 TonB-dependent receptor [Oleomonas cavernae]